MGNTLDRIRVAITLKRYKGRIQRRSSRGERTPTERTILVSTGKNGELTNSSFYFFPFELNRLKVKISRRKAKNLRPSIDIEDPKTSIPPFLFFLIKLNRLKIISKKKKFTLELEIFEYSLLFFFSIKNHLKIISKDLSLTHLANSSSFASSSVSEPRGLPLGVEPLLLNVTLLLSSLSDLVNFEAVPCENLTTRDLE